MTGGVATPPPRAPERDAESSKRLLVRFIAVALAAFALGYLVTAVLFFGGRTGDEIVTVPDLRWRTDADARQMLARLDLTMEVGPALTNSEVAEGQILAQTPLPGEEVAPGSIVRVVFSSGPERRRVPDVTALGGQPAQELLVRSGFEVEVEERTAFAPFGSILSVDPPVGSEVELPASVRLVVSTGPPFTEVPELYGMTLEDAGTVLETVGLRLGIVEYDPFAAHQEGRVIGQWPAGGEQARSGASVNVTVAGPDRGNL